MLTDKHDPNHHTRQSLVRYHHPVDTVDSYLDAIDVLGCL